MRVTMTNQEMLESVQALAEAKETGVLGYAIAKNRRKLASELKEFIDELNKLREKYNDPSQAKPGGFFIPEASQPLFDAELKPFLEEKCDVDIHHVTEEVFTGGTLNSQQMFTLEWMIQRPKQKKETEAPPATPSTKNRNKK